MKKILLLLSFILLFANSNIQAILKQIPKNSPDYTLAVAITEKIKGIKPEKIVFSAKASNQWEFEKDFFQLINLKKQTLTLPDKINGLKNKINYLNSKNTPISKLQIILFQKQLDVLNNRLDFINSNLQTYEKNLFNKLKNITFNVNYVKTQINYWNNLLLKKQQEEEKLKIDQQKWQILNNQNNLLKTQHYLQINLNKQKNIYQNLIDNYLILWFNKLKQKNKNIFNLTKKITTYASFIDDKYAKALNAEMYKFEKLKFGHEILIYQSKDEVKSVLSQIVSILHYPLFNLSDRAITPLDFIIVLIILILGWLTGKYYKKIIYSLRKKYDLSHSTATLLANMGYYFILTITFLISLKSVGLNLSSLAMIAGALSVGIGFGLQNIVSNFVSGIIMMFEKSIKVGDYIQIDDNTRGEVVDISMRSTVIRTNDNINLIIPNQTFIQNNLINWTLGDDIVRFRIPFGVAYGTDVDKVEKVVLEAIKTSEIPYIKENKKFEVTPRVIFVEMADSSLNFELFIWVKGEYAKRPKRTKGKFLKLIYNALNKAGISIPFPQQDLHITDSVPFEIKLKKN